MCLRTILTTKAIERIIKKISDAFMNNRKTDIGFAKLDLFRFQEIAGWKMEREVPKRQDSNK
jgi:hypothetical protein